MKKARLRKLVAMAALALTSVWLFAWSAKDIKQSANIAQQLLVQSGKFAPVQTILGNLSSGANLNLS